MLPITVILTDGYSDWEIAPLTGAGRAFFGEPGDRVKLYCQDVRKPVREKVDVIGAFNFSYWVFVTRDEMRAYFAHVKRGLKKDGVQSSNALDNATHRIARANAN